MKLKQLSPRELQRYKSLKKLKEKGIRLSPEGLKFYNKANFFFESFGKRETRKVIRQMVEFSLNDKRS